MCQDVFIGEWVLIVVLCQNWVFLFLVDQDFLVFQIVVNLSELFVLYDVVVFENCFLLFGLGLVEEFFVIGVFEVSDLLQGFDDFDVFGIECICSLVGCCEVVCFSFDMIGLFGMQSEIWVCMVIEVWVDCMVVFLVLLGVEYVFLFENCGEVIGVMLYYLYGQIYVYFYIMLCMN